MKKVNVPEIIIKNYTEKEIVSFLASRLSSLASYATEPNEDTSRALGLLEANLSSLSELAKMLSKKMNGSDPKIVA